MNYTPEQFFALIEAVEEQGGELTDDLCAARTYDFCGEKSKPVTLSGCGNTSIFEVPYEAEDEGDVGELGLLRLCGVCDDLGLTPRFEHVMEV